MRLTVYSLFPEILDGFFSNSIMAKSIEKGLIDYQSVNWRSFSQDKHKTCDDAPYGGGAGMVIKPEPIANALEYHGAKQTHVIYMSPSGTVLNQKKAYELSKRDHITIICGRYEGLDQRIIDQYVDEEISVGDYVLSSGETAALVLIDAVYRLLEGVINSESLSEESHESGLLEYPHYTRPQNFNGMKVPDVLLGGNHEEIRKWRYQKSLEKTKLVRPDLIKY